MVEPEPMPIVLPAHGIVQYMATRIASGKSRLLPCSYARRCMCNPAACGEWCNPGDTGRAASACNARTGIWPCNCSPATPPAPLIFASVAVVAAGKFVDVKPIKDLLLPVAANYRFRHLNPQPGKLTKEPLHRLRMRVAWLNFAGSARLSNTCANGMPHYWLFLGQDTQGFYVPISLCTCIEATGRGITTTHRGWLGLCSCSPLQWERRQSGSRSKRQPHTTLVRCVYYQQTRPAAVQLQGRVYLGATTLTIRLGHSRCRMVLLGCTRVAVQAHPVLPRDWKPPANETDGG